MGPNLEATVEDWNYQVKVSLIGTMSDDVVIIRVQSINIDGGNTPY